MRFPSVLAALGLALSLAGCGEDGVRPTPEGAPELPDVADDPDPGDAGSCRLPTGPCDDDLDCDDGCFCNGLEVCDAGRCARADVGPCEDDLECTDHECLEEADLCFPVPIDDRCSDGDACNGREVCDPSLGCTPGEPPVCNDEDPCTVDSCAPALGCVYGERDLDGDGYVDAGCGGRDCDDSPITGADVAPGAAEVCDNGRDDDCDGAEDGDDPDCA